MIATVILHLIAIFNEGFSFVLHPTNTRGRALFHGKKRTNTNGVSSSFIQLHQKSSLSSLSLSSSSSDSNYSQAQALKRRNVILPLLDLTPSSSSSMNNNSKMDDEIITPLPASHLPNEVSTLHIYSIKLKAAIHKMMIQNTLEKFSQPPSGGISVDVDSINFRPTEPMYGHVVGKSEASASTSASASAADTASSLIGSIGCASEIIIATPSDMLTQVEAGGDQRGQLLLDDTAISGSYSDFDDPLNDGDNDDETSTLTVLAKGSFRFVIKNITQTFPYPIAIVDELLDDCIDNDDSNNSSYESSPAQEPALALEPEPAAAEVNKDEGDLATGGKIYYDDFGEDIFSKDENHDLDDDDEDNDNDNDMYAHLTPKELMERIFSAMKAIVDQKLDTKPKSISPLEASILEQSGMSPDAVSMMDSMKRGYAEEMAAVLDIFTTELVDIVPLSSRTERFYVVAMFAAEFGGLSNEVRRDILIGVDGVERLRVVLEGLEKKISLVQAKKLTEGIVEKSDESSKDLQVGKPSLPPWAKSLKEGMQIEYYWSENDGWLCGTIVETATIVDELIITVLFDDGETVRLPFDPEEKVRWRPAGM